MAKRAHGQGTIWTEPRANGRQVYMGAVRVGGKQYHRLLGDVRKQGTKDGLTRAGAEARLREVRAQIEAEVTDDESEALTLRDAGERYLSMLARRNLKRATMQDYRLYLARHLVGPQVTEGRGVRPVKSPPFFADRALDSITRADVDAYVEQKLLEEMAARTIGSHLTLLSAIFDYAVDQGWAKTNPTKAVERPRPDDPDEVEEDGPRHAHTAEQVAKVLAACETDFDRALLTTAYYTGMRIGELIALKWCDLDLVAGRVTIRRSWSRGAETTTKSRKKRSIDLAQPVLDGLAQLVAFTPYGTPEDRVFANQESGKVLSEDAVRATFKAAQRQAQVPVYTMHDTRSTFATILWSRGTPVGTIQALLGHADVRTTMGYIVTYQEAGNEAKLIADAFTPAESLIGE